MVKSRDGNVRSAKVILPSRRIIGRPLNLLFPIECPTPDIESKVLTQNSDVVNTTEQDNDKTDLGRSKRNAAAKAEQRISEKLRDY